jgi:hypothetical protein
MLRIRQDLEGPVLVDVANAVRDQIHNLGLQDKVKTGQTIAITAGSRGIANIAQITHAVVDECKALGLVPFIVPAMGSHGGATADGQKKILEHYGITERAMGCPIKSSPEVISIGKVKGTTVFCDRNAWDADHIAVVARVKAHTDFDYEIESGLFKMMAIGLGKQEGAEHYHRAGHHYSYAEIFHAVGNKVLETARILFGLANVENGYEETAKIQALLPKDFYETEKALLRQAKAWTARLPFDILDLLIVDEMGKDISGAGMDPDVIGRPSFQKLPVKAKIRQLFVRDLTPESEGNAIGIGMADLTTKRLVDKINYITMNMNAITSGDPEAAKIPMAFACDAEAIEIVLGMIGLVPPQEARVVRVKNTLHLTEMDVSEALLEEVRKNGRLSQVTQPATIAFDSNGDLLPF